MRARVVVKLELSDDSISNNIIQECVKGIECHCSLSPLPEDDIWDQLWYWSQWVGGWGSGVGVRAGYGGQVLFTELWQPLVWRQGLPVSNTNLTEPASSEVPLVPALYTRFLIIQHQLLIAVSVPDGFTLLILCFETNGRLIRNLSHLTLLRVFTRWGLFLRWLANFVLFNIVTLFLNTGRAWGVVLWFPPLGNFFFFLCILYLSFHASLTHYFSPNYNFSWIVLLKCVV